MPWHTGKQAGQLGHPGQLGKVTVAMDGSYALLYKVACPLRDMLMNHGETAAHNTPRGTSWQPTQSLRNVLKEAARVALK